MSRVRYGIRKLPGISFVNLVEYTNFYIAIRRIRYLYDNIYTTDRDVKVGCKLRAREVDDIFFPFTTLGALRFPYRSLDSKDEIRYIREGKEGRASIGLI